MKDIFLIFTIPLCGLAGFNAGHHVGPMWFNGAAFIGGVLCFFVWRPQR